jgi:CheY-like chemotaxis protein
MADRVGLLLSDDLIFTSRIMACARTQGVVMKSARSASALEALAAAEKPACVIVDLSNPGLDIAALVGRLKGNGAAPRIVAYGSHVDAATLHVAREAGCDVVLPRSKFVEELPHKLAAWTEPPAD